MTYPPDLARRLNDAAAAAALNQALYLHREAARRWLVTVTDVTDDSGAVVSPDISETAAGPVSNTPGGALMAGGVGLENALRRARQWQAEALRAKGAALFAQPDLCGFARIYVLRAAWPALRRALDADPDIAIEPRSGPRRPRQSIVLRGWRAVVESCPDLADFSAAWQFASVQRAAHEAAADVLRAVGAQCYVSVDLD